MIRHRPVKVMCIKDISEGDIRFLHSSNADIPKKHAIYTVIESAHHVGREFVLRFSEISHGDLMGFSSSFFISLRKVHTHTQKIVMIEKFILYDI